MRRLMSGQARDLARASRRVVDGPERPSRFALRPSATDERRRLAAHGFAVSVVAGAFLLQWTLRTSTDEPQFWLFHVAIALTAAYSGTAATLVATLLSVLLARLASAVPLSTALLFGLEGLLIGLVVLRMAKAIQDLRRSLEEFGSRARISRASSDPNGPCAEPSRAGIGRHGSDSPRPNGTRQRLAHRCDTLVWYRKPRDGGSGRGDHIRRAWPSGFFPAAQRSTRATTRHTCRQLRADGTTFAAEIEISPLVSGGLDGFTMIVRDLTHQQARAAADWSTAEAHAQLRDEVELAQRQLSTLQDLTDPTLNSLGDVNSSRSSWIACATAIQAEGIALVHFGRHPRHLFCASEGLQCQRGNHRPVADVTTDTARTVMIHNDPAAVAEVSAAVWPDDVSSLIAVPLVRAGSTRQSWRW